MRLQLAMMGLTVKGLQVLTLLKAFIAVKFIYKEVVWPHRVLYKWSIAMNTSIMVVSFFLMFKIKILVLTTY